MIFGCVLVSLLYILFGSLWISMFYIYGLMMLLVVECNDACSLLRELLMEIYVVYHFSLWHMHCIQFIALTYGVMSWIYGSDHTGATSFIGRNDAASYLVRYEGSRHDICIAYALWFWIKAYLFGNDIEKQCFLKAWWWSVFILHIK